MFTGIVQALGTIVAATDTTAGRRFVVDIGELGPGIYQIGESMAVSGVCLTVVRVEPRGQLEFDAVRETLMVTTLGEKRAGDRVNLERSLRAGDAMGGHFVQGHIDAVAKVTRVQNDPADWRIYFALPAACRDLIVPKGSVALDGVSMTVATVDPTTFSVAVIPLTREKTTLGLLKNGDRVNIETDILNRTIVTYLQNLEAAALRPVRNDTAERSSGMVP
ncbi:MAG: riboflavin synthase [Phycisphaerae bacterium]